MILIENNKIDKRNLIAFIFSLILLVLIKVPLLHLPFYWDEAWSYAKAVNEMYTHTTTLLPSKVNQEVFRGHPLFFYFLSSIFAKISGFTPLSMHSWMLICTCTGLVILYTQLKNLYNSSIALLSSVFLIVQEVFIVQSTFLLPEIIIALLTILCFCFYFRNSIWQYILCGTFLVLTKETGLVAILAVLFHSIVLIFIRKDWNVIAFKKLFWLSLPLLVFAIFIILQKLKWGWFLFPNHVSLMDFSYPSIKGKLIAFIEFIFYQQSRKFYFILMLIGISYLYIEKKIVFKKLFLDQRIGLFVIFIGFYFAFSAVNFYSARYLLSIFPIVAIISAIVFYEVIANGNRLFIATVATAIFFMLNYYFTPFNDFGDTSIYYSKVVETQSKTFDQFVAKHKTETFGGDFLVSVNLQNPEMGYLKNTGPIQVLPIQEAKFVIATSIDQIEENLKSEINDSSLKLVHEEINKPAWCRVYQRK